MPIGWQVIRFFHSVPLVKKCGGQVPDRDYISVHGAFHGSATPDETRQVRRFPQIPARERTVPSKSSTPSAMRLELRKSSSGFDLWCRSSGCPAAETFLFPGVHHVVAKEGAWRGDVKAVDLEVFRCCAPDFAIGFSTVLAAQDLCRLRLLQGELRCIGALSNRGDAGPSPSGEGARCNAKGVRPSSSGAALGLLPDFSCRDVVARS